MKLFYTIIFFLGFTVFAFSQSKNETNKVPELKNKSVTSTKKSDTKNENTPKLVSLEKIDSKSKDNSTSEKKQLKPELKSSEFIKKEQDNN